MVTSIQPSSGLTFSTWPTSVAPAGADGVPTQAVSPANLYKYLDGRRQTIVESSRVRPLIRVADKNLDVMCELEGEIDCSLEEIADDTGKLVINVTYQNWLVDWIVNGTQDIEDLHILVDPNPAKPDWRTRWGGKITEIHVKQDDKGIHTLQLVALSHREHAKRLLIAANPIFAPEVQMPKMWIMPGPCRTILSATMFVNLARLFMPVWSTITNAFNPAGWINPIGVDTITQFLPTEWPIQVAFVNPFTDQSRWTTIGATWTDWHSTFKDILTDSGCVLRAYTYLTTDEDSPNIELAAAIRSAPDIIGNMVGVDTEDFDQFVNDLVAPKRNCVVFAVEQKDDRTGPTGTIVDGLLATASITLDDLITPITVDLTRQKFIDPGLTLNGQSIEEATGLEESYIIQKLTGTAPNPPKVIWWDGDYSGAVDTDLTHHKSSVKTTMTGGKSPTIVNEAQTFAIKYALAELSSVISLAVFGAYQAPGTPGLDSLYQGQLDNTLFAWQRFTNPIRALNAGDLSWQEHFEKGTGTAYTLATILTLRAGDYKTRPFKSFKARTLNGRPWIANQDFFLGDAVGFEKDGIIYVDNVYSIKYGWNRSEGLKVVVAIGNDKNKGDPFAAAFKTMGAIWAGVGQLMGQGWLFG